MKSRLNRSSKRLSKRLHQTPVVQFDFDTIAPGVTVYSDGFVLPTPYSSYAAVIDQGPVAGSSAAPTIRYQIVDSGTYRPITEPYFQGGTIEFTLANPLQQGGYRIRITNVGSSPAAVSGSIYVFD